MSEDEELNRWAQLINKRGIAGLGARETEEEKLIVEMATMRTFSEALDKIRGIALSNIAPAEPPLPDFSTSLDGVKLSVELTEFVDPKLLQQAKHIKKTSDHPLNDVKSSGGLWFNTNKEWFCDLLIKAILKKERKYAGRQNKIDVLLVWNEALQVGIEDTNLWLQDFELPDLPSISSVYFQSWYHPGYVARPIWSIKAHPKIGGVAPTLAKL